jgi:MFS family permease
VFVVRSPGSGSGDSVGVCSADDHAVRLESGRDLGRRVPDATVAASIVGVFVIVAALSGLAVGWIGARVPIRMGLAVAALVMAAGAILTAAVETTADGYLSATVFGLGIGALLTLVPVAFADYFGRAHYGAIRGMALPAQVIGQAMGPFIAGVLFDSSGSYRPAMFVFVAIAVVAAMLAMVARHRERNRAANHQRRQQRRNCSADISSYRSRIHCVTNTGSCSLH